MRIRRMFRPKIIRYRLVVISDDGVLQSSSTLSWPIESAASSLKVELQQSRLADETFDGNGPARYRISREITHRVDWDADYWLSKNQVEQETE